MLSHVTTLPFHDELELVRLEQRIVPKLQREGRSLLKTLDHKYLNELAPFVDLSPSSENIARYLYHELTKIFGSDKVKVEMVTVWESDFAAASYYE